MDSPRLEEWAQQFAEASPDLDPEGRRIAIDTYRHMARTGAPVSPSQIAQSTRSSPGRVEERLREWPLVLWDDDSRVIGFWGMAAHRLEPTHAIDVDGVRVYGWCAWDTLFITEILDQETVVTSQDPHQGTPVRLTVTPDRVTSIDPAETLVSLLLPEDGLTDDAIQGFCHRIHFFASADSAQAWINGRPGLFTVTVDDAFELGRMTNRLRLGDAADRAMEG